MLAMITSIIKMVALTCICILASLMLLFLLLALYTIILMIVTVLCSSSRKKTKPQMLQSAMYKGRVSHTRFLPVRHSFSYPFFIFAIDLDEVATVFQKDLWPLNYIVSFCEQDHLKNGEGCEEQRQQQQQQTIKQRIINLIQQRTNGKCKLDSNSDEIQVILLTHLRYYGYCFNPVSFYYVFSNINSSSRTLEAVVAEVSNTPWNEMHCYVLHPASVDILSVKEGRDRTTSNNSTNSSLPWKSVNYKFNKTFHVSPFMDMNHQYDWTFWIPTASEIAISTTMLKIVPKENEVGQNDNDRNSEQVFFNAFVHIHRSSIHPFNIVWNMIRFPIYCMIIQLWIHWEALLLFFKGVEFVPHPNGTDTTASRVIGSIMTPFFAAKDFVLRHYQQKTK